VNNVLVENNTFEGSMYGIRIKSPRGKGGEVKNIVYRNTRMHNVEVPLVFSAYYKAAPIVQAEVDKLPGRRLYPRRTDLSAGQRPETAVR
jgi:polygalacturonase